MVSGLAIGRRRKQDDPFHPDGEQAGANAPCHVLQVLDSGAANGTLLFLCFSCVSSFALRYAALCLLWGVYLMLVFLCCVRFVVCVVFRVFFFFLPPAPFAFVRLVPGWLCAVLGVPFVREELAVVRVAGNQKIGVGACDWPKKKAR